MLDAGFLPLRSERAMLRTMHAKDARRYVEGAEDVAVRRYAHLPEPEYTEESVTALIRSTIRQGLERGDLGVLTIADPATDEFGGSLVLFGVAGESVEVGFWVHPNHRGNGAAGAALCLAASFAQRSGFTRLTARTVPENLASQRVLEEAGFVRGAQADDVAPSGETVALLHYVREI